MNSTLFIIGVIGNIISVLVFVSPIPTFWRIVRCRSTEDFEAAPYVLTLLSSLLWLYYGLTKPDGLLVATVNGFGAVMETIYVVLFLVYAADNATRRTVIATKSVEYMPFFLFLNGGVWATYALLDRDVFLGVPNGIGFFLGGIQLAIYAVYRNSKVVSQGNDKAEYDASASLLSSDAIIHGQNDGSTHV